LSEYKNSGHCQYVDVERCVMLPTDDCKYAISLQFQNGELNCNCPDRCS